MQLRKSGGEVARAQSLKSGVSSGGEELSTISRPASRPISTTFQPVDASVQEENLTKLRKDSNEEVELCTESVNVRQIVQRLSCPVGPPPQAVLVEAAATRPKTYNDASDLSGIISAAVTVNKKKRSSNLGEMNGNSAGLTVA